MGEVRNVYTDENERSSLHDKTPHDIAETLYDLNPSLTRIAHAVIEQNYPVDAIYEAISLFNLKSLYDVQAESSIVRFSGHIKEVWKKYEAVAEDNAQLQEFKDLTGVLVRGKDYLINTYPESDADELLQECLSKLAEKGIETYTRADTRTDLMKALHTEGENE